jgi:hypothetical protein
MRAAVGAIGGLVRELRFFAEADLVATRLGGAGFVAEAVELGAVVAVVAAGPDAGLDLPVWATAS